MALERAQHLSNQRSRIVQRVVVGAWVVVVAVVVGGRDVVVLLVVVVVGRVDVVEVVVVGRVDVDVVVVVDFSVSISGGTPSSFAISPIIPGNGHARAVNELMATTVTSETNRRVLDECAATFIAPTTRSLVYQSMDSGP